VPVWAPVAVMGKPRRPGGRAGSRRKQSPSPGGQLRVFPHQIHPGDRLTDGEGREWEVTDHPAPYRQGKLVEVRMHAPGDPGTTWEQVWPAHERVTVTRAGE
jgi:hypothetical protein